MTSNNFIFKHKKFLFLIFIFFVFSALLVYFILFKNILNLNYFNRSTEIIVDQYSEYSQAQREGRMDDSIAAAENLVKENPENAEVLIFLATAYVNKGSFDHEEPAYAQKALETIERVFNLTSDPALLSEAYRVKGYTYEIMEKFDLAIENYNKSMELNNNNASTYNSRGHAFELMGQYEKAVADYLKGYEFDSQSPDILMNLARISLSKGNDQDAKKYAEMIINHKDLDKISSYIIATAHSVLGKTYVNAGDKESATREYTNSVKVLPTFTSGYMGRAQSMIDYEKEVISDEYSDLIYSDLQKVIELDPSSSWVHNVLGDYWRMLGNNDSALESYNKAIENIETDLTMGPSARPYILKFYQEKINKIKNL
jgi:tetratricopeptide (TPR) repeat protein